ncbi:MAG: TetR/AcrR family transcriptional regulator [Hyphomicrobiales bacterium]
MTEKPILLIEKQQERILQAADICFTEIGLSKTTMRDIAKQAGMSLGNIYRYFDNKKALIQAFVGKNSQELKEAFELLNNTKYFKETLAEIGNEYLDILSIRSNYLIYIDILAEALHDKSTLELVDFEKNEQYLLKAIKRAVTDGRIKLALSPEATAVVILSMLENISLKIIIGKQYSKEIAKDQFRELVYGIIF